MHIFFSDSNSVDACCTNDSLHVFLVHIALNVADLQQDPHQVRVVWILVIYGELPITLYHFNAHLRHIEHHVVQLSYSQEFGTWWYVHRFPCSLKPFQHSHYIRQWKPHLFLSSVPSILVKAALCVSAPPLSISSTLMEMESTVSSGRSTPAMMNGHSSVGSSAAKTVAYACCWDLCPQCFSCSPDLAEHIRGIHVDGQRGGVSSVASTMVPTLCFQLSPSLISTCELGANINLVVRQCWVICWKLLCNKH